MSDQEALKVVTARLIALHDVMKTIMQGNTPDHGRWVSANSHARNYNDLASQYIKITGDNSTKLFDLSKLKDSFSMVWPKQKEFFEIVYSEVSMLMHSLKESKQENIGPIYNLFVSGFNESWEGSPFTLEQSRCITEYTSSLVSTRYSSLNSLSISLLKKAPCIFAYEISHKKINPKFGYIKDIVQRQGQVRIEYEIHKVEPFLTAEDLESMTFELDIGKLELYRTHWAVKEVNLPKELHSRGIVIPYSLTDIANAVDVSTHVFDVALSFPGEDRDLVNTISKELERRLGPNKYFYDENYVSQLAQPSLDVLLQGVYSRAKLNVVFLSSNYQSKNWCGVEFKAIREIIFLKEHYRVMYIKIDDGLVEGVFKTDGYVDARRFSPERIAELICERAINSSR